MIRLVAFLGNPGREYARNRHNAGRMLAENLPFYAALIWQKKFKGLYASVDGMQIFRALQALTGTASPEAAAAGTAAAGCGVSPAAEIPPKMPEKIHFLMPETYMNLSGESVFAAASFFKTGHEEILLVHDELEIPLGTISLKFSGGLGGHNGLRSMKACFGSANFWRLRIGIGRPGHDDISGWVLSDFSGAEGELLLPAFDAAAGLLLRALTGEPEKLLPEWSKKKISGPAPKLQDRGNIQ